VERTTGRARMESLREGRASRAGSLAMEKGRGDADVHLTRSRV
jgi:hypothetical protein